MYLYVDSSLNAQLVETEAFIGRVRAAESSSERNDAKLFRPTLEVLDKLAVAITATRAPAESFLTAPDETRARFDITRASVADALEDAITFLRKPTLSEVTQNRLSIYTLEATEQPLNLLQRLFYATVDGIRHAAEKDIRELHRGSVGTFLAAAEVIRTWTANGS